MSDDEEVVYVKKLKRVYYGSLEEGEAARLAESGGDGDDAGTSSNVHTNDEYMDIEDEMSKDRAALLEEFERRKRARQIHVSTDDEQVKKNLRQLGEPTCLFGEGPADRRNRLRDLLSKLGEDAIQRKQEEEESRIQQEKDQESTWYHEGPESLKESRLWIAQFSLPRAKERLKRARLELELPETTRTARRNETHKKIQAVTIYSSQIGDARPVSHCRFSPNSEYLATSSWSGVCKLWTIPKCELVRTFRGHNCNAGCIEFHPKATLDPETSECHLASCGTDGTVKLWTVGKEEPIADIDGHTPFRVSKLEFHPSGRFLGTCVYDSSWRLWDIERKEEVLHQEGHAKAVHCISFQGDGSVVATGGLDSFARIWDLRTGRCIMFMEGHLKAIYCADFSPNCYQVATGSADNCCKIWDLRNRECLYTIPAHMNLISSVRYQPHAGHFLVTAAYDNSAKVWSNKTWQPLRTLSGHDNKIMGVDVSSDSQFIATCSYDRTYKLWAPE